MMKTLMWFIAFYLTYILKFGDEELDMLAGYVTEISKPLWGIFIDLALLLLYLVLRYERKRRMKNGR